jgi:excisionase family DNA binding protein
MEPIERILLKPQETAEAIGCSRSRVYQLIASGELPSIRVGGVARVPVAALKAWVEARLRARAEDADLEKFINAGTETGRP